MLRSAFVIAGVGVALASVLAHSTLPNRSAVEATFRAIGNPAPLVSRPPALDPVPVRATSFGPDTAAIEVNSHGQYETSMTIAGRELPALVDTGAFSVFLSYDAASSIGIHPSESDYKYVIQTANGTTRAAPATLASIRVGNVEARNVPAVVSMPGALTTKNLLGMTFLNRLSGFEIQSGRLILRQ